MTRTPPANAPSSYNDPDHYPLATDHRPLLFMNLDDTIVAIATPPGRGGIGVVRLAGPEARAIARPMLRLSRELEPNRAIRCDLIGPSPTHVGTAAPGRPAERSSANAVDAPADLKGRGFSHAVPPPNREGTSAPPARI